MAKKKNTANNNLVNTTTQPAKNQPNAKPKKQANPVPKMAAKPVQQPVQAPKTQPQSKAQPNKTIKINIEYDNVNHPQHYAGNGPIECIEITEQMSFCLGNMVKYIWRHKDKGNPKEDLEKALWYLNREKDPVSKLHSIYNTPVKTYNERYTIHLPTAFTMLAQMNFMDAGEIWATLARVPGIKTKERLQYAIEQMIEMYN